MADKAQSLGAWLLFQEGLHQLGIDISHHSIVLNDYGKPYLAPCNGYFNLSHTPNRAMANVAAHEVGCDIERIAEPDEEIVRNCFSRQEIAFYDSQPSEKRGEAFYRLWTAREAFLKALGRGLCDPVPPFSVLSDEGFFKPVLAFESRTFWGQSTTDGDYAFAWWCEALFY